MENELAGSVRMSTYQTYRYQLRHLLPMLAPLELTQITPGVVQLLAEGLREQGLSEGTVCGVLRLLSAGLKAAQEAGLIAQNPCRKQRLPRGECAPQRVERDARAAGTVCGDAAGRGLRAEVAGRRF